MLLGSRSPGEVHVASRVSEFFDYSLVVDPKPRSYGREPPCSSLRGASPPILLPRRCGIVIDPFSIAFRTIALLFCELERSSDAWLMCPSELFTLTLSDPTRKLAGNQKSTTSTVFFSGALLVHSSIDLGLHVTDAQLDTISASLFKSRSSVTSSFYHKQSVSLPFFMCWTCL